MENTNLEKKFNSLINTNHIEDIRQTFSELESLLSCYNCALLEIETKFKVLDEQFSLNASMNPISNINTRIKSPDSIYEKLQRKNLPLTVKSIEENINDVAGIRVICSFIDDIFLLANCLTHQDDITLLEIKDYIHTPKPNGYRSLHLIVEVPIYLQNEKKSMKVEVQLRTIAMEFWANLEHKLWYKKQHQNIEHAAEQLKECAEMSSILDKKMQDIRDTMDRQI